MSDVILINELKQLIPYLNDKNVLEIVVRDKNKRIKTFQKVGLSDLQKGEEKVLVEVEKLIQKLNYNTKLSEKNTNLLRSVVRSQNLSLILNGTNLCATCAGFVIMYEKLDHMGADIAQQIDKLQTIMKHHAGIFAGHEFNKVLAEHADMLDSRRRQQPYTEKRMRALVDEEYNVLTLLIDILQYDVAGDRKMIIEAVISLLSMLTVSLCYFDELYYFNHREALTEKNPWHLAHEKWMTVYDRLLEKWFVELLQDYGSFETTLGVAGVDMYYTAILDQITESKQKVEDNQKLIVEINDISLLHMLQEQIRQETQEILISAINDVFQNIEDPTFINVRDRALQQATLM